jgi:hypothetical protein
MRNSRTPLRKTAVDQALDRAVQRVYEAYGSDLRPFFADVHRQRAESQERVESPENSPNHVQSVIKRSRSDKTRS